VLQSLVASAPTIDEGSILGETSCGGGINSGIHATGRRPQKEMRRPLDQKGAATMPDCSILTALS